MIKNRLFQIKTLILSTFVIFLSNYVFALDASNSQYITQGKKINEAFYNNKLTEIYTRFSLPMKSAISMKAFQDFKEAIDTQTGIETKIKQENIYHFLDNITYERISNFEKIKEPFALKWSFTKQGIITGLNFNKYSVEPNSSFSEYTTKNQLRLPFNNKWFVFWGGRAIIDNYHVKYPSQRFAYDFVIAKNNKTFSGKGTQNEDYYCFGKEIVSPAFGVVIRAFDGVPDNKPSVMNPKKAFGNFIIIYHGNKEYSVFCHLKNGSIKVKKGQKINKGQTIGLCGNSGNSSEAHLHYHLQNSSDWASALSIPAQFNSYYSNKKYTSRGEPKRGVFIEHTKDTNTN